MKWLRNFEITEEGWYYVYKFGEDKKFKPIMNEDDSDNSWFNIKNINNIYYLVWAHEGFFNKHAIDNYKEYLFIGPVNIPKINNDIYNSFINESIVSDIIE